MTPIKLTLNNGTQYIGMAYPQNPAALSCPAKFEHGILSRPYMTNHAVEFFQESDIRSREPLDSETETLYDEFALANYGKAPNSIHPSQYWNYF
jgi:hypothetical protein